MAVSFTNNFKNILDKLRNVLRTEFKGAMPIYIGHETKEVATQYLRLDPIGSTLLELTAHSETREFQVNMFYYFADPNVNKSSLDHVLRFVSRIEALIHDNITMTLSEYVVQFEWRGQHLGNTG